MTIIAGFLHAYDSKIYAPLMHGHLSRARRHHNKLEHGRTEMTVRVLMQYLLYPYTSDVGRCSRVARANRMKAARVWRGVLEVRGDFTAHQCRGYNDKPSGFVGSTAKAPRQG